MLTRVALKDSEQLQGLQMSASSEITPPSREAALKGKLAAEAAKKLEARPLYKFFRGIQITQKQPKHELQPLWNFTVSSESEIPTHTAKLRNRARQSYVSPSREGTISVVAHVKPELRDAISSAVQQSGLTLNEFLTNALQRAVDHQTQQPDLTLHLSAEALVKTREAEEALRRLTNNLSSRTR